MSFSKVANACPSAARKATEPVPVGWNPAVACRVIAADGRPKSWSRSGLTGLERPSKARRKLTAALFRGRLRRCALSLRPLPQLTGDAGELLKTLLDRR